MIYAKLEDFKFYEIKPTDIISEDVILTHINFSLSITLFYSVTEESKSIAVK